MGRIICIDYGGKRSGIATTDPFQIIASGLGTIDTPKLLPFLKKYFQTEAVEKILIGFPTNLDDSPTHATPLVVSFIKKLNKEFPAIPVIKIDERYSSKMASRAMIEMGMKKKERQNKRNIDEIAAIMLLQEFMKHNL